MSYRAVVKKKAEKELATLPQHGRQRMVVAIDALAENPFPQGTKKLTTSKDRWRIRGGV